MRAVVLVACVLGLTLGLPSARAQEPKLAEARALATNAADELDAGHFAQALELARKAEALYHAPPHLLLIARAQEGLGGLVEAMTSYQRLAAEPLPAAAPGPFRAAQDEGKKRLAGLIARVPSLLLTVRGEAHDRAVVLVDGAPYDLASATAVPMNPGSHTVRVTAAGFASREKTIELPAKGGVVEIDVTPPREPALAAAPSPNAPAASEPAPTAQPKASSPAARGATTPKPRLVAPAIVSFSLGAAGLVAGAVTGALSLSKVAALNSACDPGGACPPSEQSTIDSAGALGNASTALLLIGAAGVTTGVVLILVGRRPAAAAPADARPVSWQPWIGPTSLGVRGAF